MEIVTKWYENRSCFVPGPVPWPGSKELKSRIHIPDSPNAFLQQAGAPLGLYKAYVIDRRDVSMVNTKHNMEHTIFYNSFYE